jgi:hypothetical protein
VTKINRRNFLKYSVLSLPAVPVLGCATAQGSHAGSADAPGVSAAPGSTAEVSRISIVSIVDVVGALSEKTLLNDNLCMMDNSPWQSTGQGTPRLCTFCQPGQLINWVVYALDLQTPVEIRNISFIGAGTGSGAQHQSDPSAAESGQLHRCVWSGVVPSHLVRGVEYKYRFELQMSEGKNSVMVVDSPSLKCI